MKKKILLPILLIGSMGITFAVINNQQKKPWIVPDNFKNTKNSVPRDATSIADGKALYSIHCKSCHGATGLGDGSKAAKLDTDPGNFSKADFQAQSDGSIYYKTSEGRDDMPNFKKKMPEADERWSIVNYMRTLKK